jgi:hypothetical protein
MASSCILWEGGVTGRGNAVAGDRIDGSNVGHSKRIKRKEKDWRSSAMIRFGKKTFSSSNNHEDGANGKGQRLEQHKAYSKLLRIFSQ